jgi:hypothetical protein
MRPMLNPALRRVWRDPETVQLGTDPHSAVVITGLDARAAALIDALDGTRDTRELLDAADALGLARAQAQTLIDLLADGGALEDGAADRRAVSKLDPVDRARLGPDLAAASLAPAVLDGGAAVLARRRAACVVVHGAGRVGAAVATLLAASGVGAVRISDPAVVQPGDVGPAGLDLESVGTPRADATLTAIRRTAVSVRTASPRPSSRVDVAVLAPAPALPLELPDDLMRRGVPHLHAQLRERLGVVGPFVVPGRSACLRCLHLHRCERDPAWPRVSAQLASSATTATQPCDTVLATAVAAQTAGQVLLHLDGGEPPTLDATLETSLDDFRTRRRSWRPHHACGCLWTQ